MQITLDDGLLPDRRAGVLLWGAVGVAALIAVSIAPIATFLVLIVGFGTLHVLTELRYVDARFSGRLDRRWLWLALGLVGLIALMRALLLGKLVPYDVAIGAEVALGLCLAVLGARVVRRHQWAIGGGIFAFAVVAILSPLHALLTVAILHNLTPMGFIAERLPPARRSPMMLLLSVPFLLIPFLIATGLTFQLGAAVGVAADWMPFDAGPADRHLAAFIPPEFVVSHYALPAFAGAVFAQSMHYLAVIVVLPRLQPHQARTLFPWPQGATFWFAAIAVCMVLTAYYLIDYDNARGLYGLFAAIHSWIEIPILIAAFGLAYDQQPNEK